MAITCPADATTSVCQLMQESGAGLGSFIEYLGQALPTLLLILIIVGIVGAVGFAIASVISGFITKVRSK
jgi:hypothetical protein